MSTPHENASILMRLYDLRRETKLREARAWVVQSFNPKSPHVVAVMAHGDRTAD